MKYVCSSCYKSFDNIFYLAICYLCDKIHCEECMHQHHIIVEMNRELVAIVNEKANIFINTISSLLNFEYDEYDSDNDMHKIELLRPYENLKDKLSIDFKTFYIQNQKMKLRFMYIFYKFVLKTRFCTDVVEYILTYI